MPKYRFIRDSDVYQIPEQRVRVLENRPEIIDFSIAEIHLLLEQLRNGDCRDLDLYVDIFELFFNVADHSLIELELIDTYGDEKLEKLGGYTKYLMRLDEEDK
jgi:hypothetical protein